MDKATIQDHFNIATTVVKTLPKKPNDTDLLKLYSLYKQATVGDCNISQPGILQFKESTKWGAWKDIEGMSKESAMISYCQLVEHLLNSL